MSHMEEGLPERAHMDDQAIDWRNGCKPDYTNVNKLYMEGKSKNHIKGSLEKIVENLVKTWEMEAQHKMDIKQWRSMDIDNYRITSDGGRWYNAEENLQAGNYQILMETCAKHLYDAETETNESSHELFKETFSEGFPWEVIEVISGPPNVVFTWRHWGTKSGPYKDSPASGETIELYGMCAAKVTEDLKIQEIQAYFDPSRFLHKLKSAA